MEFPRLRDRVRTADGIGVVVEAKAPVTITGIHWERARYTVWFDEDHPLGSWSYYLDEIEPVTEAEPAA